MRLKVGSESSGSATWAKPWQQTWRLLAARWSLTFVSPQFGPLVTLGLSSTTNISDVCACEFVITMLPDGDVCVAREGYKDFDDGAASKFVIDPHEQLKAA
jgi:hypothetical protein